MDPATAELIKYAIDGVVGVIAAGLLVWFLVKI